MELHFTKKDFDVDWFNGTGGGGQHRNKHANCCRITHRETGLRAQGTRHKERPANQDEAFRKLAVRLVEHYISKEQLPAEAILDPVHEVRLYHAVRNTVKDHASGLELPFKQVLKKGLTGLVEARRQQFDRTN